MQKQRTEKSLIDNNMILSIICFLAVMIPIIGIDKYINRIHEYNLMVDDSYLFYICIFGILFNGIVSLVIHYNILKFAYKLGNFEISQKNVFFICVSTLFVSNLFTIVIPMDYLSRQGIIVKNLVSFLITLIMFTLICFYKKKKDINRGIICTFIYCLIIFTLNVLTSLSYAF